MKGKLRRLCCLAIAAYDSLKRLTSATNPESGTTSYTYFDNGNLHTKTDARSITTTLTYDALNRVISKTYTNDGGVTLPVYYYYDNAPLPVGALEEAQSFPCARLMSPAGKSYARRRGSGSMPR